jgi:hypothetical protein
MRRHRPIVLALTGALALAGCGGDDAPSRADFAEQADKICQDAKDKIEGLSEPKDFNDIEQYAADIDEAVADANKKLGDLDVPEGEDGEKAEAFQQAFAADYENQVKPKVDELREAAEAKDEQAVLRAAQAAQQTPRTDRLAKDIGAEACAE